MTKEQELEQQQIQREAISQIGSYLFELFKDEPDIDAEKAFYRAKDNFNGMRGVNKEHFGGIFDITKREFAKPLVQATMELAALEKQLKDRACSAIQNHTPSGPDEVRSLSGVLQKLRHGRGAELDGALVYALDFVPSELRAELVACWPELLGDIKEDGGPHA